MSGLLRLPLVVFRLGSSFAQISGLVGEPDGLIPPRGGGGQRWVGTYVSIL